MDSDWPAQGKVGLATAGGYTGQFVFVFQDERKFWGFYTSRGTDDSVPDEDFVSARLNDANMVWLSDPEAAIVKRSVFAMRSPGVPRPAIFGRISARLLRR